MLARQMSVWATTPCFPCGRRCRRAIAAATANSNFIGQLGEQVVQRQLCRLAYPIHQTFYEPSVLSDLRHSRVYRSPGFSHATRGKRGGDHRFCPKWKEQRRDVFPSSRPEPPELWRRAGCHPQVHDVMSLNTAGVCFACHPGPDCASLWRRKPALPVEFALSLSLSLSLSLRRHAPRSLLLALPTLAPAVAVATRATHG